MHYDQENQNEVELGTAAAYGDMITATLFVFMLTLIVYVLNFDGKRVVEKSMATSVAEMLNRQSDLVTQISRRLDVTGITHVAAAEHGLIRISSNELAFEAGSFRLRRVEVSRLADVARALAGVLPCYANPTPALADRLGCDPQLKGALRAVAVEGHTDNVPLSGELSAIRDNMDLSALRAATVLEALEKNPVLADLRNSEERSLFYSAGYGDTQPVRDHAIAASDAENRRIEIRLILAAPWTF